MGQRADTHGHTVGMAYPLENARFQWESGWENVRALEDPAAVGQARRTIDAVREELRRRLGSGFTADELAELYGAGTDWCLDLALGFEPAGAGPHDAVDAAFWEHLRLARDFSGGVRRVPETEEQGSG